MFSKLGTYLVIAEVWGESLKGSGSRGVGVDRGCGLRAEGLGFNLRVRIWRRLPGDWLRGM